MQDQEAWLMLSDAYIEEKMFKLAAFCIEELLMLQPQNLLYQIRFADIQMLIGEYSLAIKYYCLSLETHDSLRALYGLYHATSLLLKSRPSTDEYLKPKETLEDLHDLAKERISKIYSKDDHNIRDAGLERIIKKWLDQQNSK
jgi:hypothetical protein